MLSEMPPHELPTPEPAELALPRAARDMYEQGTKEVECIVKILLLIARSVACNYRCR